MFSKMTQALILSGCLVAAGTAAADQRNVIVPVIAGAAVGAVLAAVISNSDHGYRQRPQYETYQPQPRYQTYYQPVAYVQERPRVEYRRFAPPPPRGYYGYGGGHDQGYGRGYDRGYDHNRGDGRW